MQVFKFCCIQAFGHKSIIIIQSIYVLLLGTDPLSQWEGLGYSSRINILNIIIICRNRQNDHGRGSPIHTPTIRTCLQEA